MSFPWIIAITLGYLAGSIPFGLLMGLARGVDIREHGSKNIGATNCGRVLGRKYGILCFVLDLLKGFAPVFISGMMLVDRGAGGMELPPAAVGGWWLGVAVAAVMGHVAPVWLGFKGGKGVATGFGVILGVYPFLTLPAVAAAATWIALAMMFRYVSLASIAAAGGMPLFFIAAAKLFGWPWERGWPFVLVTLLMAALIILRHRSNVRRLLAGAENKIGDRKSP